MATLRQIFEKYVQNPELLEKDAFAVVTNSDDILADMNVFPEKHLFWMQLEAIAEDMYYTFKDHVKQITARCKLDAREQIKKSGEKPSDAHAEDIAEQMPLLVRAKAELAKRKFLFAKLQAIAQSVGIRKDMLQSINARQRKELGNYMNSSGEIVPPSEWDSSYNSKGENRKEAKRKTLDETLDDYGSR